MLINTPPEDYPHRILLCLTGLAPQIVTETLYKLVKNSPAFIPHKVHVVTTKEGAACAKKYLLGEKNLDCNARNLSDATPDIGYFEKFCQDYQLDIHFDANNIHILEGKSPFDNDAQAAAHNAKIADGMSEILQQLTKDDNTALHISLTGGLRTMSYYIGSAASLFGRQQDRLSHILVPPEFEKTGAFYPAPDATEDPKFVLSNLIFLRMQAGKLEGLMKGEHGYKETIERIEQLTRTPKIELYLGDFHIVLNDQPIKLSPREFTFYHLFCQRKIDSQTSLNFETDGEEYFSQFLDLFKNLGDKQKNSNSYAIIERLSEDYKDNKQEEVSAATGKAQKQITAKKKSNYKSGLQNIKSRLHKTIRNKGFFGTKELRKSFEINGVNSEHQLNAPKESITIYKTAYTQR